MQLYTLYGIPTVLQPTFVMVAPLPIVVAYLKHGASAHDTSVLGQRILAECGAAGECLISFEQETMGRMGNWVVAPGVVLPKQEG